MEAGAQRGGKRNRKSFNCFLSSFVPGILICTKVHISFFSVTEIELINPYHHLLIMLLLGKFFGECVRNLLLSHSWRISPNKKNSSGDCFDHNNRLLRPIIGRSVQHFITGIQSLIFHADNNHASCEANTCPTQQHKNSCT